METEHQGCVIPERKPDDDAVLDSLDTPLSRHPHEIPDLASSNKWHGSAGQLSHQVADRTHAEWNFNAKHSDSEHFSDDLERGVVVSVGDYATSVSSDLFADVSTAGPEADHGKTVAVVERAGTPAQPMTPP